MSLPVLKGVEGVTDERHLLQKAGEDDFRLCEPDWAALDPLKTRSEEDSGKNRHQLEHKLQELEKKGGSRDREKSNLLF